MASIPTEFRNGRRRTRPPGLVLVTAAIALGFAAGVPLTPHSPAQVVLFDVVLLNAAPLVASVVCLRAARRVPEERLVWWGAALATVRPLPVDGLEQWLRQLDGSESTISVG